MKFLKGLFKSFLFLIISSNINLFAGSGAFNNDGSDSRALGNANAVTARCDSPATNWFNPAGLINLEGAQTSFTIVSETVKNKFSSIYGRTIEAEKGQFFIPAFFYTQKINDRISYGIGLNSAYGLETKWDDPVTDYVSTTTSFTPVNLNPNIAYRFNDNFSAAVGFDFGYAEGLMKRKINQTFLNTYLNSILTGNSSVIFSSDAVSKLKGDDTAVGGNIAFLYSVTSDLNLGLSYRTSMDFNLKGETELKGLNGYAAGVFGGPSYSTDASLKLSVPETYTFGAAFRLSPETVLEIDLEYAVWSIIDEMKIKYSDETNPYRLSILNNGNPIEKDWKNTLNYALGIEHKTNEIISVYGGTRYRPAVIPEKTFDPSLPSVDLYDITGGFSLNSSNSRWDFVVDYIFSGERSVNNTIGNSYGTSINGKYKTNVLIIGVNYLFKF